MGYTENHLFPTKGKSSTGKWKYIINKLYQLKRVNILQINFNQNLAYMLEVMVKFQRPQNVNNCIGIKSYFLYQKMVQLNLIHLFPHPFVPVILLMNHICR